MKTANSTAKKLWYDVNEIDEYFAHNHGNPRQELLYAYIAGIIDGEGSIRIQKTDYSQKRMVSPQYLGTLQLGMVEKQIPDLFKKTFGGHVRKECVPGRRTIWRWALTGRFQVPVALKKVLSYLRIKKEHAEIVIDFHEKWVKPKVSHWGVDKMELQRREDAFQKMRKLNAVGLAATTKRDGTREGEAIVCTASKDAEDDPKRRPASQVNFDWSVGISRK